MIMILGSATNAGAAQKKLEEREAIAPAPRELSAESAVPAPSTCGGMEFNREAGRMVPRPNVDLVVKHLEIFTTDRGTWIVPTIRNNCPQPSVRTFMSPSAAWWSLLPVCRPRPTFPWAKPSVCRRPTVTR